MTVNSYINMNKDLSDSPLRYHSTRTMDGLVSIVKIERWSHSRIALLHILQVIKNIKNVAGCRDTRTAKSKETRGMIEHNSEVYNYIFLCTIVHGI